MIFESVQEDFAQQERAIRETNNKGRRFLRAQKIVRPVLAGQKSDAEMIEDYIRQKGVTRIETPGNAYGSLRPTVLDFDV